MRLMPFFGQARSASMASARSGRPLAAKPGQQVVQMLVARIRDDELSRSLSPWPDPDRGSELLGQLFLEAGDIPIGAEPALRLGRRVKNGIHQLFGLPHRKPPGGDSPRNGLLPASLEPQKRPRVPHLELPVEDQLLDRLLQVPQPEQVRGRRARPAYRLRSLLVGELELVDEALHP